MMMNPNTRAIGVIGAGVMGEALISALISAGISPHSITISEKRDDRVKELVDKYGILVEALEANVSKADVLLLVVKPQDIFTLLTDIGDFINPSTLVVSFAAGKRIEFISSLLGGKSPVIRVMPNTPTLVGEGMAAMSLGPLVTPAHASFVREFLVATGRVIELGLPTEVATELTIQTMVGAAKLLATTGKSAATLRENVTSPNGTTAAALASFADSDLSGIVKKAMVAARDRSQELA
jgi:pyrroline-5-carboxylate reductase